ncbi:MAG: hypothetical protein AABX70_07775 [Nanoarchaeota archaeon]
MKEDKKLKVSKKVQEELEKMKDGEWIFELLGWRSKGGKDD